MLNADRVSFGNIEQYKNSFSFHGAPYSRTGMFLAFRFGRGFSWRRASGHECFVILVTNTL